MSSSSNSDQNDDTVEDIPSSIVGNLLDLSVEDLSHLESKIESNFKTISTKYLTNRMVRMNCLIEKLSNSIKLANANDKSWHKIYKFEIESINNIMTNTEDLIMESNGLITKKPDLLKSLKEYQDELKDVFSNLQSPFDFDDTFKYENDEESVSSHLNKLPFPRLFNDFFKSHRSQIKSVNFEKDYQTNLIELDSKNQSTIIWKQYYHQLINKKQEILSDLNNQLSQLYNDYNHLNEYKIKNSKNQYYYRSLISQSQLNSSINPDINNLNTSDITQLLRIDHDSNHVNLDTRLKPKNKIELYQTKTEIKSQDKYVNDIHQGIKRFFNEDFIPDKRFCSASREDDISDDLLLIRECIRNQKNKSDEEVEVEVDVESEASEYDDWEYTEEDDEEYYSSPEERRLRNQYKSLLYSEEQPQSPLNYQLLPPLENFPKLMS